MTKGHVGLLLGVGGRGRGVEVRYLSFYPSKIAKVLVRGATGTFLLFLCVKPLSIMVLAAYSKYDSLYTYHELLIMIRTANQMN